MQTGRVVYDLAHGVWRLRELSREPLPMDKLRYASPEEEAAAALVQARRIANVKTQARADGGLSLSGKCKGASGQREYQVGLQLDTDQRVASGECQCSHFVRHRMTKGPCEHLLALRLAATPDALAAASAIDATRAPAAATTTTDQERTARIG